LPGFKAFIGGFGAGDKIDIADFGFSTSASRSFTEAGTHTSGTLSVVNGGNHASLTLLGSFVTGNFTLSNDGAGGTLVKFT
jgi:hypothetical protein